MDKMTEQLNQEWRNLRKELNEKRIEFDHRYRDIHKSHECSTKVYAHNSNWFCNHMARARNRKFNNEIKRAEMIIDELSTQLLNEKFI